MVNMVNTDPRILRLILFILCSAGHVLCVEEFGKVGGNVTLKPLVTGKPESILWKFNNDKVVEFEDERERWFQFKGVLDNNTGVLTLKELKKGNSGPYEAEILIKGNLVNTKFTLQVMDAVGVPTISCKVADDEKITLTCSVDSSVGPVKTTWSGPDGPHEGKTVIVSKDTKNESVYFCTASNKVSKESAPEFTLKDCYSPGPDSVVPIVIGVLVAVAVVLILGILAVVYREKIKTYLPVSSR
ncbi:uncharacterized protein LOC103041163 [Astyanax mexicanus]|uniref:uncharacterized protein LOC103041163 n=1 Tax=Astyanax mexicanus TaxID=7994 RepID=UPI0020CB56C1|nr:uncharacterized protein LOC103041163 [Astyanax mexicanus]